MLSMDWTLAIEKNREALRRVLAMLVAMVAGSEWRERRGTVKRRGTVYFLSAGRRAFSEPGAGGKK